MSRFAVGIVLLARFAAAQPDAGKVLKEVESAYKKVRGYQLEAVITWGGDPANLPPPVTLAVAFRAPNTLMLRDKSARLLTTYDDRGVWTFDGGSTSFEGACAPPRPDPPRPMPPPPPNIPIPPGETPPPLNTPLPEPPTRRAQTPRGCATGSRDAIAEIGYADFRNVARNLKSARIVHTGEAKVADAAISCIVIEAAYADGETATLWIDATRHAVLRAEYSPHARLIQVVKLSWGTAPPDSVFYPNVGFVKAR